MKHEKPRYSGCTCSAEHTWHVASQCSSSGQSHTETSELSHTLTACHPVSPSVICPTGRGNGYHTEELRGSPKTWTHLVLDVEVVGLQQKDLTGKVKLRLLLRLQEAQVRRAVGTARTGQRSGWREVGLRMTCRRDPLHWKEHSHIAVVYPGGHRVGEVS